MQIQNNKINRINKKIQFLDKLLVLIRGMLCSRKKLKSDLSAIDNTQRIFTSATSRDWNVTGACWDSRNSL